MIPDVIAAAAIAMVVALVILASVGRNNRLPHRRLSAEQMEIKLTRIEPGTFLMGDPAEAGITDTDFPHPVTLTRPFLMGTYCVTVREFSRFVAETGFKSSAEKACRAQGPAVTNYQWLP